MAVTSPATATERMRAAAVAITGATLTYTDEVALHGDLARVFTDAGIRWRREVPIDGRGRIDFLLGDGVGDPVGNVGVEVKVAGGPDALARQARRYLESPLLDALLIVTTRARHTRVDLVVMRYTTKPIQVVSLLGQAF